MYHMYLLGSLQIGYKGTVNNHRQSYRAHVIYDFTSIYQKELFLDYKIGGCVCVCVWKKMGLWGFFLKGWWDLQLSECC